MDPLISVEELRADTLPMTLLDVRWSLSGPPGRAAYEAGHLPGAAFVDIDRDLAASPGGGGRHPLPSNGDLIAGCAARGSALAERWSATTSATARRPPVRGGCFATSVWLTCGCLTGGTTPGSRPTVRSSQVRVWRPSRVT